MEENTQPMPVQPEEQADGQTPACEIGTENPVETACPPQSLPPISEDEDRTREALGDGGHSTDGLVIGIAVGMVAGMGFLLRQMPIWIVVGILFGGASGFWLDLRNDRRRAAPTDGTSLQEHAPSNSSPSDTAQPDRIPAGDDEENE